MSYPPQGDGMSAWRLSGLMIDVDKDWNAKKISNVAQLSIGDLVFANNWRLTEIQKGIALMDDQGNLIRRWTNG